MYKFIWKAESLPFFLVVTLSLLLLIGSNNLLDSAMMICHMPTFKSKNKLMIKVLFICHGTPVL